MKRTAQLVAWDPDYEPDYRNGDFDPKRPWGYLWWLATSTDSPSTAEWAWWDANFDKQAQQIAYGVTADTRFLGSDAPVATRPQDHFATAHDAKAINEQIYGGGGGARGGGGKAIVDRTTDDWGSGGAVKAAKGGNGKGKAAKGGQPSGAVTHAKNAKGRKLCAGFQHGSCKGIWLTKANKYDTVCPRNKDERHNCNVCLATDHGSSHCPQKLSKKQRRAGKFQG